MATQPMTDPDLLVHPHTVVLAGARRALTRAEDMLREALVFAPGSASRRRLCKDAGDPLLAAINSIVEVARVLMAEGDLREAEGTARLTGYDEA